jgi:hypothetical protein
MERRPKCVRRDRGRARRWPQGWDHEGRSSFGVARTESVGAEPTPQGDAADFRDEALRNHVLPDLLNGEARQRQPKVVGEVRRTGP